MACKILAKLKMLKKEIITPKISYQWVVQKVISSYTNIYIIRKAYKEVYILEGGLTPYLTQGRDRVSQNSCTIYRIDGYFTLETFLH